MPQDHEERIPIDDLNLHHKGYINKHGMMAKGWVEVVVGWLFGVAERSVVGCLGSW